MTTFAPQSHYQIRTTPMPSSSGIERLQVMLIRDNTVVFSQTMSQDEYAVFIQTFSTYRQQVA